MHPNGLNPEGINLTEERPLFFTSRDRPLYGVFHPREKSADGKDQPVVVFCNSIGLELMTASRIEAQGARLAARCNYPAFRYHPRGQGDSSGDTENVTFGSLIEDAMAAGDYARQASGASKIIWVGVRFGALVASEVIRRREDCAGLVLWEPIHKSRDFFRTMLRGLLFAQIAQGSRPDANVDQLIERLKKDGQIGIHGSFLHETFYSSATDLELGSLLETWAGPTLIVQIQRRPTLSPLSADLKTAVERRGSSVTVAHVLDDPSWDMMDAHPPWSSLALLNATGGWLNAIA